MPANLEFVKNALGKNSDMPVLRFDGSDDFLAFEEVNSIRTVLWLSIATQGMTDFYWGTPPHMLFIQELTRCGRVLGLTQRF